MSDIRIIDRPAQPTAGVRERVPMAELTSFFSRAFEETMAALRAQGRHPVGPPFGRYYGPPTDTIDVEAGFPVAEAVAAAGRVRPGTLPGGDVIEATHVGPYDTLGETYAAIERFLAERSLAPGEAMWESYLSDPGVEPDPAGWQTRVCWLVGPTSPA
ncbi:GyrI-like domain-containing protein [Microbacterium sp. ARD31]|uniref:GyrI-like domain-containing protein n=1 Tax=Microbacterium sp. ARD31 TaxID=2962576 RepID=UPI002881FF9A|nr:GyrI-like domain-containing protein [Microbacterium sp. ARD31]MDT0180345.1 GyrI-like domain-containing protein [Microbacterium sp. ARD31]